MNFISRMSSLPVREREKDRSHDQGTSKSSCIGAGLCATSVACSSIGLRHALLLSQWTVVVAKQSTGHIQNDVHQRIFGASHVAGMNTSRKYTILRPSRFGSPRNPRQGRSVAAPFTRFKQSSPVDSKTSGQQARCIWRVQLMACVWPTLYIVLVTHFGGSRGMKLVPDTSFDSPIISPMHLNNLGLTKCDL